MKNTEKSLLPFYAKETRKMEYDLTNVPREDLISVQEEVNLIKQIRASATNCEEAKEKLIRCNQRFVWKIAEKFASENHTMEELVAEGNKGLEDAIYNFDETRGFKFISYAVWWIRESIRKYVES